MLTQAQKRSQPEHGQSTLVTGNRGKADSAGHGPILDANSAQQRFGNQAAIRSQLGRGTSLEHSVRTRMNAALGHDFSDVRLHTDANAAALADSHDARAFTVGEHVAFAAGEYRPGTPVGDALIAHELAHVVQQGTALAPSSRDATEHSIQDLESDADASAAGAIATLYGDGERAPSPPRRSYGLSLQRCPRSAPAPRASGSQQAQTSGTPCPTGVSVGALSGQRGHDTLGSALKARFRTQLGVMSRMDLAPGPDHTGHCMKERLRTVSNTCPAQMYEREDGERVVPCSGDRCLDVNRYGNMWGVSDGPASFLDMHQTRAERSMLEGTGVNSCSVVCEQTYLCDRTDPTNGTFRITRNFRAGTHQVDGRNVHITTGTVDKR